MFVDYRNFWVSGFFGLFWPVFGGLWEPLGCLGCLRTAIGAPFVTFGDPLGHLWGGIGLHLSPLGVHWGSICRLWDSICRLWGSTLRSDSHDFWLLLTLNTFKTKLVFVNWKKRAIKRPKCELDCIFVAPNRARTETKLIRFKKTIPRNLNLNQTDSNQVPEPPRAYNLQTLDDIWRHLKLSLIVVETDSCDHLRLVLILIETFYRNVYNNI